MVNRLLIYIGRFALILIGYVCAALAASAAMHILIMPTLGFSREMAEPVTTAAIVFSIPFVALFVGYFSLLPSLVVIAIAELWSIRGWLFHALGGGLVGLVLAIMFRDRQPDDILAARSGWQTYSEGVSTFSPSLLAVIIGAGIVGGLAYWLIAGQTSGSWKSAASTLSER